MAPVKKKEYIRKYRREWEKEAAFEGKSLRSPKIEALTCLILFVCGFQLVHAFEFAVIWGPNKQVVTVRAGWLMEQHHDQFCKMPTWRRIQRSSMFRVQNKLASSSW